jgi:hypothetical protein
MSFLAAFLGDREAQLNDEEQIDAYLTKNCSSCAETLALYYGWRRHINRIQFKNVSDASFFEQYGVVKQNVAEISEHQEFIKERIEANEDPCIFLAPFVYKKDEL